MFVPKSFVYQLWLFCILKCYRENNMLSFPVEVMHFTKEMKTAKKRGAQNMVNGAPTTGMKQVLYCISGVPDSLHACCVYLF
jgi:hypothetical protein